MRHVLQLRRSRLLWILVVSSLFLPARETAAAQYRGDSRFFRQPDGGQVEVRIFGTEFYVRGESPDGYALTMDAGSGFISYAERGQDGGLRSTGIRYRGVADVATMSLLARRGVAKGLRANSATVASIVENTKRSLRRDKGGYPSGVFSSSLDVMAEAKYSPTLGSGKGLVVLVDFSDRAGTIAASEYDKAFNGDTYDSLGSIRSWIEDISYQKYTASHTVIGYMRAAYPTSHYVGSVAFDYSASAELMKQVYAYIDQQVDLTSYASNGAMPSLVVIYPGAEVAAVWATGLWPHAGEGGYTTSEKVRIPNAFISNGGTKTPMDLDTFRHELGHSLFNWPDTYDYDDDSASAGGYATETTLPCAPFRMWSGWLNVIDVAGLSQVFSLVANGDTCLRYKNAALATEYFVVEYMKKDAVKRADTPDEGLLIWHVDEKGDNSLQDMTPTKHYELSVEQADGLFELEKNGTKRANDLFHAGNKDKFDDTTTPNSNWWVGTASGFKVCNVGALDPSMSVTVGCAGTIGTGGATGTGGVTGAGGAGGVTGTGGTAAAPDAGRDGASRDLAPDSRDDIGQGGSQGTGGVSGTGGSGGGTTRNDAAPASGGAVGSGGGVATGGVAGSGGAIATGGAAGSGGAGGMAGSGGVSATGGTIATAGSSGGGGAVSTGGSSARDAGRDSSTGGNAKASSVTGCSCALGAGKARTSPGLSATLLFALALLGRAIKRRGRS